MDNEEIMMGDDQHHCGTTYTESEHYYECNNVTNNNEGCFDMMDEDNNNNNNNNNIITNIDAQLKAQQQQCDDEAYNSSKESNHLTIKSFLERSLSSDTSIESLRDRIASDVIVATDTNKRDITIDNNEAAPYTMFTSPFEINYAEKDRNTDNSSQERYYQVPLIYCDQTASNRPLNSIEQYIYQHCLPYYGNTHTNTSITGKQCTAYVAEARQIVAEMTNAKITGKASTDIVLFTGGNGATAAIELFIDCLNIKEMCRRARQQSDQYMVPVILIGPYEHHSNLIPWRETGCEIIMIPENPNTQMIDYIVLEEYLQSLTSSSSSSSSSQSSNRLIIGTFTAASNVTGKLCNVTKLTYILHKYNGLAIFDYATASSYVTKIDMNPTTSVLSSLSQEDVEDEYPNKSISLAKDAIFISPHKMIGGSCSTPGILIIKKHLVSQINAPNRSGGGTVLYVTHTSHRFLSHRIHRYEGGTPNIIGIIRVGLIFLLKRQIDYQYNRHRITQQQEQRNNRITQNIPKTIEEYDIATYSYVAQYLKDHAPNLVLLGYNYNDIKQAQHDNVRHLPIFSFLIQFQKRFLHYNFVCALLNDIFGIQSRGGCQCSGPYSQQLLGLVDSVSVTTECCPNDDNDTSSINKNDSNTCTGITYQDVVPNAFNHDIEEALYRYKERAELLRPGYTRLSLPFKGLRTIEMQYVLKALVWISKYGWSMMCQYRCNHRTGEWRHKNRQGKPFGRNDERKWLSHYSFFDSSLESKNDNFTKKVYGNKHENTNNSISSTPLCKSMLDETFVNAEKILADAKADQRSIVEASKMVDADSVLGNDDDDGKLEKLRWYVYPKECADLLLKGIEPNKSGERDNENDRGAILGAIQPTSICAMKPSSTMNYINGRKRKNQFHNIHDSVVGHFEASQISSNITKEIKSEHELENDAEKKKGARTNSHWGTRGDIPQSIGKVVDMHESKSVASTGTNSTALSTESTVNAKKQKFRHIKPPPKLMRTATQAIVQWDMINEGDRLLLGLSGGKDSLSLLHVLLELKRIRPIKFELEVCTIDPMTPSFDPSPLIPYVESLGIKYHYIRDDIVSRASNSGKSGKMVSSLCAYCARMKRGNLYSCARRNNCNKLVLAQHLDDCAESMMMSMMHNGFLRTMKANYSIDAGDLSVIRPLIYCREGLMTAFAKDASLPVINENCPACFEEPKERARIKKMLSREETLYPTFYDNIRRSLIPLMHDDMAAILRAFTDEALARSRKIPWKERNGTSENKISSDHVPPEDVDSYPSFSLTNVSDDALILELARRKAAKQKAVSTNTEERSTNGDRNLPDYSGEACTLNGGHGTIPCFELME